MTILKRRLPFGIVLSLAVMFFLGNSKAAFASAAAVQKRQQMKKAVMQKQKQQLIQKAVLEHQKQMIQQEAVHQAAIQKQITVHQTQQAKVKLHLQPPTGPLVIGGPLQSQPPGPRTTGGPLQPEYSGPEVIGAYPQTSSGPEVIGDVVDLNELVRALDQSSRSWALIIDFEAKQAVITQYFQKFRKKGIPINKPPAQYVQLIDELSRNNAPVLNRPFAEVLQVVAIIEYDFNNGQNKDALALKVLGSKEAVMKNRERLGLK